MYVYKVNFRYVRTVFLYTKLIYKLVLGIPVNQHYTTLQVRTRFVYTKSNTHIIYPVIACE